MVMGVFDGSRSGRRAAGLGSGPSRGRVLALVLGAVLAGSLLAGCDDGSGTGTVVRVVDGDTLVAVIAGEETTVRLLNIDTPETKHPDLPVQCLGPEATEFLVERLPAGTEIELEYDEERLDRYDRTLAGVYESGSLVNAEIAAEDLGVPVYFEPNDRFLPEVEEAAATAEAEGLGLFSAAIECTVPAQIEQLGTAADQIPAAVDGDPADALAEATALVEDAESLVESLEAEMLGTGTNAVLALPLAVTFADGQREAAEEVRGRAVEGRDRLQGLKDDWDEEQERLREEQERLEREQREREERERLEREEREREEEEQQEREEREERERREREAAPAATDQGGSERSNGSSSSSGSGSGSEKESSGGTGGRASGGAGQGGSGGEKSGSGGGKSGSGGSGGGSSSCVPYGPEISYSDDGGYTGKRYGMPGGKTFRKCR